LETSDTSALIEVIKKQNKSIESLRKTIKEMGSNTKILREQIDFLNRKHFGPKSEKTTALTGRIAMHEVFEHGQFDEEDIEADLEEDRVCSIDGERLFPAGKKYLRTGVEYTSASMRLLKI